MTRIQAQSKAIIRIASELQGIMREKEAGLMAAGIISSPFTLHLVISPPLEGGRLGFYDPEADSIVIGEDGCLTAEDAKGIFLHELAHALDFRLNGSISGHSPRFREYCVMLGLDRDFSKSRVRTAADRDRSLRERIRKLMALSSSPFENEASQAILKAQQLMMECRDTPAAGDDAIYTADLCSGYRLPGYIPYLLSYLRSATGVFGLRWTGSDGLRTVRIHGSLAETELAVYIYTYIISASEKEIARLRRDGKHVRSSSFILGAIAELRARLGSSSGPSLALISAENERKAKEILYSGDVVLRRCGSRTSYSPSSYGMGSSFGSRLDIPSSTSRKLIGR